MDPSVGGVEGDGEEELPLVFKEWRYKHNTPSTFGGLGVWVMEGMAYACIWWTFGYLGVWVLECVHRFVWYAPSTH